MGSAYGGWSQTLDISSDITTGHWATHLAVSDYPSPTTAGTSHTFTVTALDPNNNTDTNYRGTVHFTSSDTDASLPANYTFTGSGSGKDNGTHTFIATLNTTGTWSITATDTVKPSITGIQSGITVNPTGPTIYFSSAIFSSTDATGSVTPSGSSINTQTLTIAATPTNNGVPKKATVTCAITNNSGAAVVCTGVWSLPHDTHIDSVVFSGVAFGSSIANGATASGTITVSWSQEKDILLNATVTFSHVP